MVSPQGDDYLDILRERTSLASQIAAKNRRVNRDLENLSARPGPIHPSSELVHWAAHLTGMPIVPIALSLIAGLR